jgi:hypothetical protein
MPHPKPQFSSAMLVGIQSLILFLPDPEKWYAASRQIVAVNKDFATAEIRKAAENWIQENQARSHGFLVNMGDGPTRKT